MLDGRVKTLHPRCTAASCTCAPIAEHCSRRRRARHSSPSTWWWSTSTPSRRPRPSRACARGAHREHRHRRAVDDPLRRQEFPGRGGGDFARRLRAIADEMASVRRRTLRATQWRLAQKAFATTAAYDSAIASTLERVGANGHSSCIPPPASRRPCACRFRKVIDLRYGENPHQKAAMYSDGSGGHRQRHAAPGQRAFLQQHGRSAGRLGPGRRIRRALLRHHQAHQPLRQRHRQGPRSRPSSKAFECDPVSAFGGVIALNRPVDGAIAEAIAGLRHNGVALFIECIVAP